MRWSAMAKRLVSPGQLVKTFWRNMAFGQFLPFSNLIVSNI
jgi:hypothetical protein